MRTIYPGERQAAAIHAAKAAAAKLADLSSLVAMNLDVLDAALRDIIPTDPAPELGRALDRIDRLRELRNLMELGAYKISVSNALDEAWQRLP